MSKSSNRIEQITALVAVSLLVVGCFVVLRPFVSALLWAGVLCFSTWPFYQRLEQFMPRYRNLAALIMTLVIALVLVVPFVVVGLTMADSVAWMFTIIQDLLREGLPEPPHWLEKIPLVGDSVLKYWQDWMKNTAKLTDLMKSFFLWSRGWLLQRGLDMGEGIFQLTLSVLITFFFYRDGERVVVRIAQGAKRIIGDRTQHLLAVVGATINGVVYGILGTAMAQGILAVFGFWIAGIPSAFLLGVLTFLLAPMPFGPPFIWIPATLWLFYSGQTGWSIFMGIWGLLVVSSVDNVLRPYLISRGSNLPFILVLLGVLGGIIAFGFIGIFLGPILLAVGYCLINEWAAGEKLPESETPPAPPAAEAPDILPENNGE